MSTSYNVSDFLKDRHPYNNQTGFRQQAENDKNKLFDGYGLPALQHNIESLTNPHIAVTEKLKVMKIILGHLTSAETKLRCIKYGLVPSLKYLVEQNLGSNLDELVCIAFRSFATNAAGVYNIYQHDALVSLATVLAGRMDQPPDEALLRAREAASEAVLQMTIGHHAHCLLLGEPVPQGMVSVKTLSEGAEESEGLNNCEVRKHMGRQVVDNLVHIITAYNNGSGISLRLLKSALQAISNLSSEPLGLDVCLICGTLKEVDQLLRTLADQPEQWLGKGGANGETIGQVVYLAVNVVWNVCMDPIGKRKEESLTTIPMSLGRLLLTMVKHRNQYLITKGCITGAISAIYIYEEAKITGIQPLVKTDEEFAKFLVDKDAVVDIALLAVLALKEANDLLAQVHAGKAKEIDPNQTEAAITDQVTAYVKNTVQAIRLLSELPVARSRVSAVIGNDKDLVLQLFKTTPIENEMIAAHAQLLG